MNSMKSEKLLSLIAAGLSLVDVQAQDLEPFFGAMLASPDEAVRKLAELQNAPPTVTVTIKVETLRHLLELLGQAEPATAADELPAPPAVIDPVVTAPTPAPVVEPVVVEPTPEPIVVPSPVIEPVVVEPTLEPIVAPSPVVEPVVVEPTPAPVVAPAPQPAPLKPAPAGTPPAPARPRPKL